MARRVLFITDDMQRWDTIGAWNGPHAQYAQTPVLDRLAREGIQYWRAYNQNPLCMPSRSTMLTGQYPRTHGSWNNGIALPHDSPTVAEHLKDHRWRTALIGKPHFEPFSSEHSMEANLGINNRFGPARGFDHMQIASHDLVPRTGHYTQWLIANYPDHIADYYDLLNVPQSPDEHSTMNIIPGGDTGAIFVKHNPIPKELYHTDWVADHTIKWIDSVDQEDDWFCWMSFPDPHHPYDPPQSELGRVNWRDIGDVDELFGSSDEERLGWLEQRPAHWKWWYTGEKFVSFEAVEGFEYQGALTPDNVREMNAMIHIENAIMDDAIGRVIDHLEEKGWLEDTDIIFTPDHGGMDGDSGLMLIGPALIDSVTRCTLLWKPAASRGIPAADVHAPVGLMDIPATVCDIGGVGVPEWMEGRPLPTSEDDAAAQGRDHVFTQYEGYTPECQIVINGVYADGWQANFYERTQTYEGTEGELFHVEEDPRCRVNRWDDPDQQARIENMRGLVLDELLNRPMLHPMPEPGALI